MKRENVPKNFEQLDLAVLKGTATLLYQQIEFLFTRKFVFSVKPRIHDNIIVIYSSYYFHTSSWCSQNIYQCSLTYKYRVYTIAEVFLQPQLSSKAAKLIPVGPGHRTEFHEL